MLHGTIFYFVHVVKLDWHIVLAGLQGLDKIGRASCSPVSATGEPDRSEVSNAARRTPIAKIGPGHIANATRVYFYALDASQIIKWRS